MTLPIPKAALSQHLIVLGKTGAGKSSAMRVLVEGLLDAGDPVCILDPKGDWYGIKSSADGKQAGYPLVIFGGEHADVPINVHAGAHLAELVATGNRPCIIDMRGWMTGERTRFFIDFASTLSGAALQRYWLERLPEGERKVLEVLLLAFPDSVERTYIDEQTGYKRSSRDAYIQRLKARGLVYVIGNGEVIVSQELFA